MSEWLMLWTPDKIVQVMLKLGWWMVLMVGLLAIAWRHGWPWFRKRKNDPP